jgi:outer membrane protein assembly factor BamB
VLAPLGVAYNIQPGASWKKIVKPRPPEISDWTHFAYDASGNCVAPDTVVGPPKRYQWLAGPKFNRHHDVMSSFNAGVSANGRLFHVMDEGSRESILLPGEWFLVARDAFNGTLLWKRPISSWHPSLYGLKSGPTQLTRRLVAVGDVVYVTLDYYGPVVALDAATGAILRTYDQTSAAQEIYLSHGTLFVLVDLNPKQWATWEDYYNTSICMNTPSTNWNDHARVITAVNAATGQLLWTNSATVYPTSIAVDTNGLVFHDGMYVRKLDRNTGASLWTSTIPVPVLSPTYTANGLSMILYKDTVLMAGGPGKGAQNQNMNGYIWSVDSTSGQVLTNWIHGPNSHLHSPNDLFVFPGLTNDWVWSTSAGATNPMCVGYDRRTGTPMRTNDPGIYIDWIHERCYRSKATVNYFLTSRACLEVIDARATNWGVKNDWVRSACLYGFIPCNGLIYTTPNDCSCQFEAKLTGLGALAPASTDPSYPPNQPDGLRLQPGAAYGQAIAANPSPDDWPIYRHDQDRSGYTSTSVPAALSLGWQTALGGKLSSLTVAEGRVFVASVDTHTVFALDVAAGTNVWSYTVGGRVDSPPTIYKGRVLFGSADGYVYCLRATDGALIWRFLAAFTDRRHMSYEQVESVWPVSGSVLAVNDKIYCVAGRSMYLDGGCKFWALNPTNGAILAAKNLDDKVPGSTNSLTTLEKTYNGPVALADLLSSDGQRIFMKSQWFDLNGVRTNIGPNSPIPAINAGYPNQIGDGVHLFTPTGFLDDNWMHRSYWVWGKYWSSGAGGYYIAGKNAPCGQILSIDDSNVYGFGRKPQYYRWTVPKENMLFSTSKANNFNGSGNPFNWTNTLPFFVKAMVATPDSLFLAGPPDMEDEEQSFATLNDSQTQADLVDQDAALHGAQGGQLRVVSKADGSTLASYSVDFLPVWDGMAAAGQQLFLATLDGRVVCYHRRP